MRAPTCLFPDSRPHRRAVCVQRAASARADLNRGDQRLEQVRCVPGQLQLIWAIVSAAGEGALLATFQRNGATHKQNLAVPLLAPILTQHQNVCPPCCVRSRPS